MQALRKLPSSILLSAPTSAALKRQFAPWLFSTSASTSTQWQNMKSAQYSLLQPTPALTSTIIGVSNELNSSMLKVQWEEGREEDLYPYVWLRYNCQCPSCFHHSSMSRSLSFKDLSFAVACSDVKVTDGGEKLEVRWTDGHQGTYTSQWLRDRAFGRIHEEPRERHYRLEHHYWGCELQDNIPRVSFEELLHNDTVLLSFMKNLEILGVVLVTGTPIKLDQIHVLTKRINGYLKPTHYGETFLVEEKFDPNNLAYTGKQLDFHSDLTCLTEKPSIQLLHCIKQVSGEGGDTQLTDGFATLKKLREKHPKHFDVLANTMVEFEDVGVDDGVNFNTRSRVPVIELEVDCSIRTLNWHPPSLVSHLRMSPERVAEWYKAKLILRDILYDPNNIITYKLQPGEIIIMDNFRVLHGRKSFEAKTGERLLQGAYWDWDSIRSLRRVIQKRLTM